jgi:hypothetical protein
MGLNSYLFRRLQVGEFGIGDMKAKIELKVEVGYWRRFNVLHGVICDILKCYEGSCEYFISSTDLIAIEEGVRYELEKRPDDYGDMLTELYELLSTEVAFWDTEAHKGRFWKYYYRAEL